MSRRNASNSTPKAKMLEPAPFGITFMLHSIWCIFLFNNQNIESVIRSQKLLGVLYGSVGLYWKGAGSYLVAGALVSSFLANALRRTLEGVLLGWPRFIKHNKDSLRDSFLMLLGYGLLTFFAAGFFGEKFSEKDIDLWEMATISAMTYIFLAY